MEKIQVAVIGCGSIANSAHGPSYAKIPEAHIAYCVDIIPERAQKFKEKFGAIRCEDLLASPAGTTAYVTASAPGARTRPPS